MVGLLRFYPSQSLLSWASLVSERILCWRTDLWSSSISVCVFPVHRPVTQFKLITFYD